jgi:hypothetical protein
MKDLWRRISRGPEASALLRRAGINPRQYWLLMDLFHSLSQRREMLNQLGRDGTSLKIAFWLYLLMSALMAVAFVASGKTTLLAFSISFVVLTGFMMLGILISETCTSLVNPVEGLVLAHQPIEGASYAAAKLSHLLRILLYLVPALNLVPAFAGLFLKGSAWWYPILHLTATMATGLVVAMFCCAVFGYLLRFVPARRVKNIGQMIEGLVWLAFCWGQSWFSSVRKLPWAKWWAFAGPMQIPLEIGLGIGAVAVIILGLRSLSADYLIRVATLVHGGAPARIKRHRRSHVSDLVARYCGGPAGRAGFDYSGRMMRRDWNYRKALIPSVLLILIQTAAIWKNLGHGPFTGTFTWAHVIPHLFGVLLFFACLQMQYGADHKGVWVFLTAPSHGFDQFVRGVHALLWLYAVAIPHCILFAILAWRWNFSEALVFTGYSIAVASVYLSLEIKLIDGVPFGKQVTVNSNATLMPLMMGALLAIGIVVALQYFLIFQSPWIVLAVSAALAATAVILTRRALVHFASAIRFHLSTYADEVGKLYQEVV